MIGARTHFERVIRDSSANVVCGVGFADLWGFTALTQTLTPAELSMLLNEFSATVSDVVHANGGRVVKFIGDEVMWVSSTPEQLATAAVDLVNHPKAGEAGLAARLVAAAAPGQILASQPLRAELPDWDATVQDPLTLKGFDAPVTAYELHGHR
jgi:class 3 adenylate cyclase